MASQGFFFGSKTFTSTLLAEHSIFATSSSASKIDAQSTSLATQIHRSRSYDQQCSDTTDETASTPLIRSYRRLSTIQEETEDEMANAKSRLKLGQRRVSLQKEGWTVPKGEPTSPTTVEGQKQSSEVQAHILSSVRSLDEVAGSQVEDVPGFSGWNH
jgi:hypothetical protein